MGSLQYIPSFYFYKFANAISNPYTSMDAYRAGIIDSQGNLIGNESSIDSFEYFIIKLKKIFEQLPPGITKYKLGNLIGTMQIFSEEVKNFGLSESEFNMIIEAEILSKSNGKLSYIDLLEDMATGGEAGALGVPAEAPEANKGNISGYEPRMGSIFTRSEPMNMIGSVEMFNIPSEEFKLFKANKYYPKSSTGNYLRRFGHRNPNLKIAVKDEETGEIYWLPKANKKSLIEQFYLQNLKILKESTFIEPETTPTGRTAKSEVWALEHIKRIFDKNGFIHIPWGEKIKDPLQYKISPGQKGREDIVASNSDGEVVPVEAKSIKGGKQYSSFNIDLSTQKTPKGVATYGSVAHGLADIYDPEYEEYQARILRDKPIDAVAAELEKQKGIRFQATQIPGIRWKALRDIGISRVGTPEKARERVMDWRKGLLDMAGNEKGGVVLAVNPEQRHLHVLSLETGEKASAVTKLLADLGGLRPTGTASTSNVGRAMFTPDPKMAKSSGGRKMLRVDYRFTPEGGKKDPWVENGNNALGGLNIGNREDFKDWEEVMDRLTKAK